MGVFIELIVDPADMGKIIGRNGHTAQAIRTIMKAFGKKHQANISIQIKEPAGSARVAGEGSAVKSVDEAIADLNM
jgi:ribosomal protein S3